MGVTVVGVTVVGVTVVGVTVVGVTVVVVTVVGVTTAVAVSLLTNEYFDGSKSDSFINVFWQMTQYNCLDRLRSNGIYQVKVFQVVKTQTKLRE